MVFSPIVAFWRRVVGWHEDGGGADADRAVDRHEDSTRKRHEDRMRPSDESARRKRHKVSAPVHGEAWTQAAPAVLRVLLSGELLPLIAQYQEGLYPDAMPFVHVHFGESQSPFTFGRWITYLDALDLAFRPWYAAHGFSRIRHLRRCIPSIPGRAVIHAASTGNIHALHRWRRMYKLNAVLADCILAASTNGQFNVIELLHADAAAVPAFPATAIQYAAVGGHLGLIQFFHVQRPEVSAEGAMAAAAEGGHLHVLKWLHANRKDADCGPWTLDVAARGGHLSVVRWLHEVRGERGSAMALEAAAERGHLAVVRYLREAVAAPWTRPALKGLMQWTTPSQVMQDAQTAAADLL
ncbi:Aste57867_8540 [Aphanomyces stellatus]|uniref:Aste57867_8540 protein n=1 Tax=Aphanomyces stellatus TaxID=120398 RepID=A0A485KKN9_9STRA|nr:hypothetical protein As57867_008508 [Aphanomyces stellatus]VFT85426.1 Aste57867_8540 [Aphanomyces stellatus]